MEFHPDDLADQRRSEAPPAGKPVVAALVAACAIGTIVALAIWAVAAWWPDQTPNGCAGLLGETTACAEGM